MRLAVVIACVSAMLGLACNGDPAGQHASDGAVATMGDAGVPQADAGPVSVYCAGLTNGCQDDLCVFGCCNGSSGGPGAGCAGCCQPKPCNDIPADKCPLDVCQVMTTCSGRSACTYRFSGPPPACGSLSYYGQDVACCPGLQSRCGAAGANGSCDPTAGGYNGFPWCLPCGDGVCEPIFENACNCPEDCR